MGTEYVVKNGDFLSKIAQEHNIGDWKKIYDHPANERLRKFRPDPNQLEPGDIVYIPDAKQNITNHATSQKHTLKVNIEPIELKLKVMLEDEPIKNAKFELTGGSVNIQGQTDGSGQIDEKIPSNVSSLSLSVWTDADPENPYLKTTVNVAQLAPCNTLRGVKARLNNLGYDCGEVNDELDALYYSALMRFQEDNELEITGNRCEKTLKKLEEQHES